MQDAIEPLSEYVANLRFQAVTPEAVQAAKIVLLDAFGVAMAGSSAPGVDVVLGTVRKWGGSPESTVLVFGDRVPAPWAALVNGMMIQARDFDNPHPEAIVHVSAGVLPATLAAAQSLGGVDGRRFLTAFVAGVDVACRIGKAISTPVAFARTGTLAFFGAAAAVCNILELDALTTRNAFGIAYAQSAGNIQAVRDGALVKRMHAGLGAKGGLMSALWALGGLTGSRQVLEGAYGYLNLYERGAYQRERMLEGLGKSFEVTQLILKPYPCALPTHAAVAAALELRGEHSLRIQDVDHVTVEMPPLSYELTGKPYDAMQGHRVAESLVNVSYAVAVALKRGRVDLDDFTEETVGDAEVGDLARRVEARPDVHLPPKAFVPVTVRIYLRDGQVLQRTGETLPGSPQKPLSREQRLEKFWHCAGHAARPLPVPSLKSLITMVDDLENLPDVSRLAAALAA